MSHDPVKAAFFRSLAPAEQLLALFDLIPEVSFFVKDRAGRFMTLSLHKHEHCGVKTEEDAIGKTDHDFFPSRELMPIARTTWPLWTRASL